MIKPKFDELIHAPTRLSLVSLLAATEWADFQFLRDSAGLSDSALSKQLTTLEDAGYIEVRKGFVGKRPRTSARSPASAGRPSTSTSRPCRRSSPRRARRCSPRPERRKEGSLLNATFARGAKRHTHTAQGLTLSTINGDLLWMDGGWPGLLYRGLGPILVPPHLPKALYDIPDLTNSSVPQRAGHFAGAEFEVRHAAC